MDLGVLPWTRQSRALRARLALLHTELGSPWPAVSDGALGDGLWLAPFIVSEHLRDLDLVHALTGLTGALGYQIPQLVPEMITVPSGRMVKIDYPFPYDPSQVRIKVKLQECFGLTTTPTVLNGQIPITLDLLSPAGRILASTVDIEFFWREIYPEVRSENRGRYAKHPWPENPLTHQPTAATTRMLRGNSVRP